jgi:phenylalanyl-tRNA synthetase beta chain
MKIAYSHLVKNIIENPSIENLSDSLFQLGHEHEVDGNIYNMEFTPNRGDCLSINGLLKDLAVFYTVDLKEDIFTKKIKELSIDFKNLSENICPQVTFLKLEIDEIPQEYSNSLDSYFSKLGLNKNNFFTDISNYLSYETGQPTHCYDADKMEGKLIFHEIETNEQFETLLGKKITLSEKNAVFSLNNRIINLAGIMGGKDTSCSARTKTVIVECAFFQPEAIIGKSVKYDIQSDASHKYERGVDPNLQEKALRRFIHIVSEHANIKDISIASYKSKNIPVHKILIDVKKINQIIGININKEEYLSHLLKLGFAIEKDFVLVPSFRSDIRTNNDLAEEIARVIGYDNIDSLPINIPKNDEINYKDIENKLRYFLIDHGFYEVVNSPFIDHNKTESLKVDNPLDSNRQFLRTNITESLLSNLLFNEKRQKDSIKLFEISDIYFSDGGSILQKRNLSIIASGRVGHNFQDFSKKINEQYLLELFQKIIPKESLNFNIISRDSLDTKIKSEIISLEVDIGVLSSNILSYQESSSPPKAFNQYSPISEQPSSIKDISYSIKDYSKADELQHMLLNYKNDIIKYVYIFDYFYNEKREEIKIGFRFVFQAKKTTLTSNQIDEVYNDIINKSLKIEGLNIPGI